MCMNLSGGQRMNAQDFQTAVRDNPDDDALRLVFADWLEDHGEGERGELIRLQCKKERLPNDEPQREELVRREDELLAQHGDAWLGPWGGTAYRKEFFRRGWLSV